MLSSTGQWTVLFLNYVLHSSLLIVLVLILIRFRSIIKPSVKEHLLKFVLIGSLLTMLIQSQTNANLFRIPASSEIIEYDTSKTAEIDTPPSGSSYDSFNTLLIEPAKVEKAQPSSNIWIPAILVVSLLLTLRFLISRNRFLSTLRMTEVQNPETREILHDLTIKLGLRQRIGLLTSPKLKSPIAISKRRICIPERSIHELSYAQMESVLAHELAHIARKDPQWLLFINIITNLFYFQPLNRLVRDRVKEAMEDAADRIAVNLTGDPATFSETLLTVARWDQSSKATSHALGFASTSPLKRRVQAVLNKEKDHKPKRIVSLLILLSVTGLVSFTCPEVSLVDTRINPEFEVNNFNKNRNSKTPDSLMGVVEREKQSGQIPLTLPPELQAGTDRIESSQKVKPTSLVPPNNSKAPIHRLRVDNESSFELPLVSVRGLEADLESDEAQNIEMSDMRFSRLEMLRLRNINYERFKRDFWPMLISSGLLKRRINSVELTYQTLTVNGRPIDNSKSQPFQLLIETHFDQDHWDDFQYRRDGLKVDDLKRSVTRIQTKVEGGTEGPSEWRNNRKEEKWQEYRAELASRLLEDGVIKSISDNISIKWRKDKVFINRKKFKGADFSKYRSIKNKYFSASAT